MVMQATGISLVGGSNPRLLNSSLRPRLQFSDQESNHRPQTLHRLRYHSTGDIVIALGFPTA